MLLVICLTKLRSLNHPQRKSLVYFLFCHTACHKQSQNTNSWVQSRTLTQVFIIMRTHANPVLLRWSRKHTQWLLLGAHTYSLSGLHATSCMLAWSPQMPAESQCCVSHHGAFFVVEVQFVPHSFIFPPREKPTTPSTLFLWYKQSFSML